MSIRELPLMGALRFRVIFRETFHFNIPCNVGKAGVEFITNNGQKISGEAIPMVVLVMDGVGEGNLGMVTTFCHHDQAKVEASEVLSALCQCDSAGTKCGCSEEVHQLTLSPMRVLWFPLPR